MVSIMEEEDESVEISDEDVLESEVGEDEA